MPRRVVKGELATVQLDELHEVPGPNPNVMTPEQEELLRKSIRARGFRQSLTVVPREEGGYWVSDGVHRVKVLRELGYAEAPALVKEGTVEDVRAERLALNRDRGQVDLSLAAGELRLLEDAGYDHEQLAACGFSDDELEVLLKASAQPTEAQVLDDGLAAGPAGGPETEAAKRYTLTLTFDRREERDGLRARLLALGPSAEDGLRALFAGGRA